MEDQVQAKLLCYLGCFRDHPGNLFPLLGGPPLISVTRNPAGDSVSFDGLSIRKNEERSLQGR